MLSSNDERALTLLRDIAQVRFIAVALLGLVSAQCHLTKYRLVRHLILLILCIHIRSFFLEHLSNLF